MNNIIQATAGPETAKAFVNAKFLADRWGVTEASIYNWGRAGRIPSMKCGRTIRFPLAATLAAVEGAAAA